MSNYLVDKKVATINLPYQKFPPHGYVGEWDFQWKPRNYQIELLSSPARFKICVWHRRAGKSMAVFNDQVCKAISKVGIYYYVLPTYRQAKQVAWDKLVKDHVPRQIVSKMNESELAIYYKNGSIQRFVGCEDPDKLRGINVNDVVFDEFSEEKAEIWDAIFQPILRENKGTATFIFTPKGKNHAWLLLQRARLNPNEWFWSIKGYEDTETFTKDEIEEIKKNTTQAMFEQEYGCHFMDGAGSFFSRIKQNTYDPTKVILDEEGKFQLGVDLAKYSDWTVITPFNQGTGYVYPQDRFNQVDWNLQKSRIESAFLRYNKQDMCQCCIDTTGLGDPIVDDLRAKGVKIPTEPLNLAFKFNENSRYQLLNNLNLLIQQDKIKIPKDDGLIEELESMTCELTEQGKMKIKVPSTLHDDRIMSLALAVYGWKAPAVYDMKSNGKEVDFKLYSTQYD